MALATSTPRSTEPTPIPVRRLDLRLDPATVPVTYYGDDVHLTTMLNALSVLFPEGEKFFVDAVRNYKNEITDPRLMAEIAAFVGQEAMHSKEHLLLTEILEKQGLTTARTTDVRLKQLLDFVRKTLPQRSQLAATCALEHFTALLAERLIDDEKTRLLFDESVRGLWAWHALEESEHKNVAFDVYEAVDGSYAHRSTMMVLTTIVFFAVTAAVYAAMLNEQKALYSASGLAKYVKHFWFSGGFFRELVPAYFEYFKPGFHPSQRGPHTSPQAFADTLFGEGGMLHKQLKQVRHIPMVEARPA